VRHEVTTYVALGGNLGDARATLVQAIADLAHGPGLRLLSQSPLYRTAPIDSSGADYVNAVVELACKLSAPALLAQLQRLEQLAGRQRPYRNAPRTLDLDILLYGQASMQGPALTIPHPRMRERLFVMQPLADIAPHLVSTSELQALQMQAIERL
jgi:2-amino-4-hydroxy-6-hydroxymethyldihydropteridine diphosphokinase